MLIQEDQPLEAELLVGAQFGVQRFWQALSGDAFKSPQAFVECLGLRR